MRAMRTECRCVSHALARVRPVDGDAGGPALFRLVRFWSRRWARGVAVDVGEAVALPQHVLVIDAVDTLTQSGDGEATIGDLAEQLGLDHSGASRMARASVAEGYLERGRGQLDGRRGVLRLTPAGVALLEFSLRWQRSTFAELTKSWDAHDRAQLAGHRVPPAAREPGRSLSSRPNRYLGSTSARLGMGHRGPPDSERAGSSFRKEDHISGSWCAASQAPCSRPVVCARTMARRFSHGTPRIAAVHRVHPWAPCSTAPRPSAATSATTASATAAPEAIRDRGREDCDR